MSRPTWSIKLALEERELRTLSKPLLDMWPAGVRMVGMGGMYSDEDSPFVTFELDAASAREARLRAQDLVGKAMRTAGIRPRQATVIWVAPLSGEDADSLRFLEQARTLLGEECYELAVVAAQIHLEVQVQTLIEHAKQATSSPVVETLIAQQRSWAPHDRWSMAFLDAIFDIQVTEFPRWSEYKAHVTRRNAVVHRGQVVDESSAESSVRVVSDLWLWLIDLAGAAAPHLQN